MRSIPRLPSAVDRELKRIGAGIQTARLRRNMSQKELGERIGVTFHTVRALEAGRGSTAFGYYLHALWVLGLLDTVSQVADPALDREGLALEVGERQRARRRGRTISNEF